MSDSRICMIRLQEQKQKICLFLVGGLIINHNFNYLQFQTTQLEPSNELIIVSNNTGEENNLITSYQNVELTERTTVKTIFTTAGTTFFASLVFGIAFGPIGPALIPIIGDAGAFIAASACGAAASGLGVYGGVNTWEWYKGSGTSGDKREILDDYYLESVNVGGFLLYHELNHFDSTANELESALGSLFSNVTYVAQIEIPHTHTTNIQKRDNDTVSSSTINHTVWTFNYEGMLITTTVINGTVSDSASALAAYVRNETNKLDKRYNDGEWFSYSTYGMNPYYSEILRDQESNMVNQVGGGLQSEFVEQVQSCTNNYQCYAIAPKGCLAVSHDRKGPGIDSDIVGEFYYNTYGGVDNECDSL